MGLKCTQKKKEPERINKRDRKTSGEAENYRRHHLKANVDRKPEKAHADCICCKQFDII